ncbi:hypothetical protein SASPL_150958 [Salvia splendens]|uniref:La protein 1 n=1 Tax=Salvia splendens TaxID=180675 RepID=A0A8X8W712_SALSN|nr:hypothetical protein SASPL_150958 [Salvia splendens]
MALLDDETAKKVIRQVEFYFSDSNLPRDKFLMKTIRGHLNLGDVKPEDVSEDIVRTVAETLKTSTFLKMVLCCSSAKMYPVNCLVLCMHVNSVRLPRHFADNRLLCGGCCKCFEANPELELKPRAKQEEVAKTRNQVGTNRKETNNAEPDCPKGLIVAFTLKSMSADDSTKQTGNHKQLSDDVSVKDGDQEKTQVDSEETKKDIAEDVIDATNYVENADEEKDGDTNGADTEVRQPEDNEKSEDIPKEERITLAACKDNKDLFIDFQIGENSGYIRFENAESAQKARAATVLAEEGVLVVKNFITNLDPLTGDAEKDYWNALRSGQVKHRDFKNGRGRGGRHNNRGAGRHSGWKHSRGRDNDHRTNKALKV